jgi:hypothetical protein
MLEAINYNGGIKSVVASVVSVDHNKDYFFNSPQVD